MKVNTQRLWEEFRETGDVEIRNRLVEKYLYVVEYVSIRLARTLSAYLWFDEIRSAASYGLIRAVENFDHRRGTRFETYCATRIKGAVLDELRARDWVPRRIRNNTSRMSVTEEEMKQEMGRSPTPRELAEHLGVSPEKVETMIRESNFVSIFTFSDCPRAFLFPRRRKKAPSLIYEDDFVDIESAWKDPSAKEPATRLLVNNFVAYLLEFLDHKERAVVILSHAMGISMKKIGEILGLTESRISQIRSKAMKKLKQKREEVREVLEAA